jgi:hypothetical protein
MEKQAIEVDPHAVARFATGGVLAGAGSAALLNLVRMVKDMRERQAALTADEDTNENTIVLTLPRKTAEVTCAKPTTPKKAEMIKRTTTTGPGKQPRRPDGTAGPSVKYATAWPSLTLGVLAGIGGTAAGAHIVNKLYQKHREKELGGELEMARQEYLDALQGGKTAAAVDRFLGFDELEKVAGEAAGLLNLPMAAMAIMSILGGAGTGYVTKRVLDEKFRESQSRGLDIPKVQRIVFKSQPNPGAAVPIDGEEEEKEASADDLMLVKAAICVMCDALDSEARILNVPYVKTACDEAGIKQGELLKSAQDINSLFEKLQSNPKLQKLIVRAGMSTHPVLKHFQWAANVPGVRGMLYNQTTSKISDYLKAPREGFNADKGKAFFSSIRNDLMGSKEQLQPKQASLSLLSSVLGSSIAGNANQDDLVQAVVAAQRAQQDGEQRPEEAPGAIEIESSDPGSDAYVSANREKIMALVQQLQAQGKL